MTITTPYSTPLREQQPATACTYICTYACDIYRAATFTATARLLMIGDTADSSTLPKKTATYTGYRRHKEHTAISIKISDFSFLLLLFNASMLHATSEEFTATSRICCQVPTANMNQLQSNLKQIFQLARLNPDCGDSTCTPL